MNETQRIPSLSRLRKFAFAPTDAAESYIFLAMIILQSKSALNVLNDEQIKAIKDSLNKGGKNGK